MNDGKQNPLGKTLRALFVLMLKATFMGICVLLRLFALTFSKISELIEKSIGHDKHS